MLNKLLKFIDGTDEVLKLQSKSIDLLKVAQGKTTDIIAIQQQYIEDLEVRITILEKQLNSLTDKTCH